jgi:acetylornithine deacetylase/succinyl-diaminopimelate desuccinylase-like protein
VLLLAHIDVAEARPEDWTRDPFTLVEESGSRYHLAAALTRVSNYDFPVNMSD